MTPVIYLASSIDQGRENHREEARQALLRRSCALFDPAAAWTVTESAEPSPGLQRANMALLRQCDGVLAVLSPGRLTVGVILEIQESKLLGIPTQVYAPGIRPSWSLSYLGIEPHADLNAAVGALMEEVGYGELSY